MNPDIILQPPRMAGSCQQGRERETAEACSMADGLGLRGSLG